MNRLPEGAEARQGFWSNRSSLACDTTPIDWTFWGGAFLDLAMALLGLAAPLILGSSNDAEQCYKIHANVDVKVKNIFGELFLSRI